jgi:RNA polymerase III RPC4
LHDLIDYFVASKRSVALTNKKLITDVKIKTEPVDEDVAMGEFAGCMVSLKDFMLMSLHLPAISDSPENSLINGMAIKMEPGIDVKSEEFHRFDKLFEANPNEFILFQMPDTLPGRAPDAVDTPQEESSSKSETPNLCSLEHLEEGLIGKLVRYKSGKTKLVLGDTYYDVDLGLTSDFQQHAVTINANTTERSASLYSLGQINSKYNVSPDWIHLFHKMTP